MSTEALFTHDLQVENCLEKLCTQGCRQVTKMITLLESGKSLPHCRLNHQQYALLLEELKSIMAVYDETGSCTL